MTHVPKTKDVLIGFDKKVVTESDVCGSFVANYMFSIVKSGYCGFAFSGKDDVDEVGVGNAAEPDQNAGLQCGDQSCGWRFSPCQ